MLLEVLLEGLLEVLLEEDVMTLKQRKQLQACCATLYPHPSTLNPHPSPPTPHPSPLTARRVEARAA